MSDPVKPEEKPVVIEPPKVAEEVPTTSEPAPATVTDEVTPVDADKAVEEVAPEEKKEEKPEPKEITHGTLSKAHGGLLALFKQKRFFYFQDEPIPEDKLKTYLHKDTASHSTAAYASQTGKGLLLYSKTEGQKVPHGIVKLADVTDVVSSGNNKFILKLKSNELHLESSAAERDSWVFTLSHKIAEAKAIADEITNSEGYKASFGKLTKLPTASTKAQEKAPESKEQETEDTEPKPEKADVASTSSGEEEPIAADKKAEPKRSLSKKNKRTSRFPFLEKKKKPEEKKEESNEKEEEEEEPKDEVKPTEPEIAPIALAEGSTDVPTEAKESADSDEADKSAEPVVAPKPTKRNSLFGTFFGEKKEKEIAEEKKEDSKNEIAEPSETTITEAKPTEISAEASAPEKILASSPKSNFFSRFDKREKSPAVKTPEKEIEIKSPEATTETPDEAAETTPIIIDDSAVADSTSPATSPKEQRRKSFFSFNKRDKRPEEVKSDSEDVEPAQKSGATSPTPKSGLLTGLMRKASKATKNVGKDTESKEVAAPEPVSEEPTPGPATTEVGEKASDPVEPASTTPIGDVPETETVTTGQASVQATA